MSLGYLNGREVDLEVKRKDTNKNEEIHTGEKKKFEWEWSKCKMKNNRAKTNKAFFAIY